MSANPYQSPETKGYSPAGRPIVPSIIAQSHKVIGAVVLVGFLLLPFTRFPRFGVRESVRRVQCSNHLKQIGLALQNYHDAYGTLPPAYVVDAAGKPIHSWRVLILPYLGQKSLYDKYSFNEPWNGPNNSKLYSEMPEVYACPSSSGDPMYTSYFAVIGDQTAWPGEKATSLARIIDGAANAIVVVEMVDSEINWLEPKDLQFDQLPMAVNPPDSLAISSGHPTLAQVLFADGHIAALTDNTPAETIRRLLTIADGEPVGDY